MNLAGLSESILLETRFLGDPAKRNYENDFETSETCFNRAFQILIEKVLKNHRL
jgi:hypothetical protein